MFQRTEHLYITVLADIIVITCAEEALAQVVCCQIMFGIATVTAGSGTVDDDEVGKNKNIAMKKIAYLSFCKNSNLFI
jgi:hypothetical protein